MFGSLWGNIKSGVGGALSDAWGETKTAGAITLGGILGGLGSKIENIGTDMARTQAGALPVTTRARIAAAMGGSLMPLIMGIAAGTFVIWIVGRKR